MFPKPKRTDHSTAWSGKASQKISGKTIHRSYHEWKWIKWFLFSKSLIQNLPFTHKPFPTILLPFYFHAIWEYPDFSMPCYRESLKCGEEPEKQQGQMPTTTGIWTLPVSHNVEPLVHVQAGRRDPWQQWLDGRNSSCKAPNISISILSDNYKRL